MNETLSNIILKKPQKTKNKKKGQKAKNNQNKQKQLSGEMHGITFLLFYV